MGLQAIWKGTHHFLWLGCFIEGKLPTSAKGPSEVLKGSPLCLFQYSCWAPPCPRLTLINLLNVSPDVNLSPLSESVPPSESPTKERARLDLGPLNIYIVDEQIGLHTGRPNNGSRGYPWACYLPAYLRFPKWKSFSGLSSRRCA